ncbi:MAG TPA: hypothetical protein VFT83_04495 [Nitrososphaeraceae archaeon]|nr:hypothetical protein [Nitrososphaeraceae archaeon]
MHKKSNKMNLSNPIVIVVVLTLLSSTVVIFFPLVSEQQQDKPSSVLKLAKANVSIDIPTSKGYIDGNIAYFIATDASDEHAVSSITNNTGFPVNYAPLLNNTPESIRGQGYVFLNGVQGEAPGRFQLPVANAVPGDKDYSPLWQTNFVKWNDNATARELKSVEEIVAAQNNGELTITETNIIVNSPAIKWQMIHSK